MLGTTPVKHVDIVINASVSLGTFTQNLTGVIATGSTDSTRTGNLVHIKCVNVEYFVNFGDATNFVKSYLLLAYNGQATAPTFSGWMYPPDNDQFLILADRMSAVSSQLNPSATKKITHMFPGRGLLVRFDTSATGTEIINRLFMTFVSDSSATPDPFVQGYARVYFTDG